MRNPQHPDAPAPAPDTGTAVTSDLNPREPLSVEVVIAQARQMRQHNADIIGRRLGRGERLSAEVLYDTLHAQILAGWWLLVDRHIRHARGGRGLPSEQTVARFVAWISPYLDDDASALDTATNFRMLGLRCEHELALAHFERALALIRQDAARTFLTQAKALPPASPAEAPSSSSAGREAKA
ncbi:MULTISPECIES: hypothetical protein [Nonomuraea]|uniref:hypothetical protein n=1 Tax=Nonomuraea ceibae TaxID=1935170 RepID=UPI001C5E44B2|nr:hypothetical protein [Nonomuraea ceibae]